MTGFIENLRSKPEGYRRGVAFGTSFLVTLMIAFVWVSVAFPGVGSRNAVLAENTNAKANTKTVSSNTNVNSKPGPIASFRLNTAQTFGAVKLQWDSLVDLLNKTEYQAEGEFGPPLEVVSSSERKADNTATNKANSTTNQDQNLVY